MESDFLVEIPWRAIFWFMRFSFFFYSSLRLIIPIPPSPSLIVLDLI